MAQYIKEVIAIVKFKLEHRPVLRLIVAGLSPRSVAGSIIIPIVLVTILAGAAAIAVGTDHMATSAAQNVEIRLDAVATQAAEQIGGLLARSLGDTSVLSNNPVIKSVNATPNEKLAEMKKVQIYYGTFQDVTLVDPNGDVITSTNYEYDGQWATSSVFQTAVQGIPSMSDVTVTLDPYTVLIQIASPVMDENRNITSVLVAQMSMDFIWQIIDRVKVGKTGYVCLIDNSGNIIAGPDKAKLFTKIVFAGDDSQMPSEHKLIQYNDDGSKMCAVISGINPLVTWAGNNWSFVGIMPATEAFSTAHEASVVLWIVIGLLLFLFVAVGLVLGRIISSKINALAKGTAEIAKGNLSYRLREMKPRELGELADSFNSMAARIEASNTEIARWNAHLKEQVEAKTKELEKVMAGKVQSERLSAMGYIAASVAHELNDPITAISGYTQLGLKELSKPQTPEETPKALRNASDYFKYIEKELQRSKTSIRKLLSFVRHSKTGEGPVDVNQVLNDTLTIAGHHLEINKVELLTKLEPELPLVVGNDQQFQQAFLNIVLFAQKSMPRGGKLVVETRRDGAGNKSGVEVLIAGSGSSTSLNKPESIFEPSSPESLAGEGIELDLSVSHDIIKQYGGSIGVKSETGVGTKFIISLTPVDKSPSGDHPAK